ncbi:MAG TPA: 50S ribosomal protein L11 methyltransferase [Gaiellaceae bacterium]|nr:50S ribosomal protein L11 methyltransferase [Gaiellaceae bacterium]
MTDERPLRRVSITVSRRRAEEARATMIELFPEGFEEIEDDEDVQLAAYTDASGEERLWSAFGGVRGTAVEAGWEDGWRRFHQPVTIGPLWVGPPWEKAPDGPISVVIDPGRAFGTGAHATTRLCLELLAGLPRGSLLDVGCGSGVLAIAGAKLGFAPVTAVDNDPLAVEATCANAEANGARLDVQLVDAAKDPLPTARTAVANISLDATTEVAGRLDCERLVTSGYLVSNRLELARFRAVRRVEDEGWAADLWESVSE